MQTHFCSIKKLRRYDVELQTNTGTDSIVEQHPSNKPVGISGFSYDEKVIEEGIGYVPCDGYESDEESPSKAYAKRVEMGGVFSKRVGG